MLQCVFAVYRHVACSLVLACFTGFVVLPAAALVPGPILLNDDTLSALQQTELHLQMPATRAKAACLRVATQRFCPGMPFAQARQQNQSLSPEQQQRVVLVRNPTDPDALQAVFAFLPAALMLPALSLDGDPLPLPAQPRLLDVVLREWPAALQPLQLEGLLSAEPLQGLDLSLHYDSQRQLGLVVHQSEAGMYVVGVFALR